jgi:probable F420-dependent oxidoreductase
MKFTLEMPLGVVTPPDEFQTMAAVSEMARALEAAGADAGFITDHPAPDTKWLHQGMGHDALDPFTSLAFVAAATTTLKLHTNIVVLPYRNPFITAKAAATLQVLSGGRLILGAAVGYQKAEFEALGVDFHKRGALTDEALEVMRMAWSGQVVVKQGAGFNAPGNEPRPAPTPQPLIWIGGASDKALERAAKWGDGWCPFYAAPGMSKINESAAVQSVEHLRELIKRVQDLRAKFGKTGHFDIAIGPRMKLKDRSPATAQRYLEMAGELAEAGVTWSTADVGHESRAAYVENVQWFGEEIISRVRS